MPPKRKSKSCGALWVSFTQAGDDFLSGTFTLPDGQVLDIAVWKNKYKTAENRQPEYYITTPDFSDLPAQETDAVQHPF